MTGWTARDVGDLAARLIDLGWWIVPVLLVAWLAWCWSRKGKS